MRDVFRDTHLLFLTLALNWVIGEPLRPFFLPPCVSWADGRTASDPAGQKHVIHPLSAHLGT